MEKVEAYKTSNGSLFESKEDAITTEENQKLVNLFDKELTEGALRIIFEKKEELIHSYLTLCA